jgi:TetR/AcrR family transcriptional repressor of mexCD-oprJ operon
VLEHAPREALQQRVGAAILEAAARTLAVGGERASMNDVAVAAGVARATLYRYFPSRQALLQEVGRLAVNDAGARLESARINEVALEDGVARAIRALVEVGDYFIVLARERIRPEPEDLEEKIAIPLRQLVERGQATGGVRQDVPSSWLTQSLLGLVVSVLSSAPSMGKEDTVAVTTSLFLNGASDRQRRFE